MAKEVSIEEVEMATPKEPHLLAEQLWYAVQARYPFLKWPNLNDWAHDIDKLQRIDGYSWELIEGVMNWSQEDNFWRQQIRSGANLRKHFEKMLIRIKENESGRHRVYKI